MSSVATHRALTDHARNSESALLHLYHPGHEVPPIPLHESPSLRRNAANEPRAYELKFLLTPHQAAEVESRLAQSLSLDPHADPTCGNGYRVTTLYCDTPNRDVYHRRGRYKLFKLRLRRYGLVNQIFLERKAKRKDLVRKRRSIMELDDLRWFTESNNLSGFAGWYHRQLRRNQLEPTCLVEYLRTAYFGTSEESPIRLTFDRHIRGGLMHEWSFQLPARVEPVLVDRVVCEFKFRGVLPSMFKSVIEAMQLIPGRVSKYRLCVQAASVNEIGSVAHA
jgi:hypothetical protein